MASKKASDNKPRTRRPNGEGSFVERPNGKVLYRDYVFHNGKRIRKGFTADSKTLAKQAWKDYCANNNETPIERVETVEQWAKHWLEIYKKPNVSWKVYSDYKMYVNCHIIPAIGPLPIVDVKPAHIARLYALAKTQDKKKTPLARSSLEKIRIALNGIFDTAIDNNLCLRNPVAKVPLPEKTPKKISTFTQGQMTKIVKHLSTHPSGPYVAFLLYTGLRVGELLTLMWTDIDTKEKVIHVRRSLTRSEEGEVVGTHTKTKKERIVPYDKALGKYLRKIPKIGLYVICREDGSHHTHHSFDTLYYTFFNDLNAKIQNDEDKIPRMTPHKCRHTFATFMLRSGVDIRVVQMILGHSSIKTTEIYTEIDVQDMQKNIAKLNFKA